MQEVAALAAVLKGVGAELEDRLARLPGRCRRRQRSADGNGDRQRHAPWPFPQEAAVLEAEDAAPHPVEMNGDYRHVEPLEDALEAAPERQRIAGAADRALGEDADDMAGRELGARLLEGGGDALRVLAGDRDRLHQAEQPGEAAHVVVAAMHQEAHEALGRGADQQPVDEGEVIAHEQRRPARRQVLRTDQADAIDAVGEQPQGEADDEFRQQP
jgi:hypothetical protein